MQFDLQQLAQKAVDLGLEPLLSTLVPRHKFTWFQSGCPPASQRTLDGANTTVVSLNSLIADLSTSTGWPFADLYGHFYKLANHDIFGTYYQNWQWMRCDPDNPDFGNSGDPVGHPNHPGIDMMAFDFKPGWGQTYADTLESHVKALLPPRLTLTPPGAPTTGVGAVFSAALPDLGQTASLHWDFGDGGTATSTPVASPTTATHTYFVPGPYTVTVTAYHGNGGSRTASVAISVGGADLRIFLDDFESGDATAWSAVAP